MHHISTTPFGRRAVSAGLLATQALAAQDAPVPTADKYTVLDDLRAARAQFGISDRDLGVLAALLSFHTGRELDAEDPLIVYPSNRTLSDRAFGMAESTLRRHLAALVAAGLILRHDSPNGKRYAARDQRGTVVRAFGFSLRPLLVRAAEIAAGAQNARAQALQMRRLREDVVLMLRDATKLLAYAEETGVAVTDSPLQVRLMEVRRAMRRRLNASELGALQDETAGILAEVSGIFGTKTNNMSGSDAQNGRHYQNSNKDTSDFESSAEKRAGQAEVPDTKKPQSGDSTEPKLPLHLVLKACPDILPYARDPVRHWHQLIATASEVRAMMGISAEAWETAQNAMGPATAAITIAAILQRVDAIRNPGGYLRALSAQAETQGFSPGPMVMALLNPGAMKAA